MNEQELPNLLHGNETRLNRASAYIGQKEVLKQNAPNARDFINKRAGAVRWPMRAKQATGENHRRAPSLSIHSILSRLFMDLPKFANAD
jgi:hypothetical protein